MSRNTHAYDETTHTRLRIATYNVECLPELILSQKTKNRIEKITEHLSEFDVVAFQEIFDRKAQKILIQNSKINCMK